MNKDKELIKLRDYINEYFGVKMQEKTRKRKVVYCKKVYCAIGFAMGYTLEEVGKPINFTHDKVLYAKNTVHSIYHPYKVLYNELIDVFNLDVKKFNLVKEAVKDNINKESRIDLLNNMLNCMTNEDIKEFTEYRVKPFLKLKKYDLV